MSRGLSIMKTMLTLVQMITPPSKGQKSEICLSGSELQFFHNHLRPSVFVFFSSPPGRRPSDETTVPHPRPAFSKVVFNIHLS